MIERLVDLVHADIAGYFEYREGGVNLYSVVNRCPEADFDSDAVREVLPSWSCSTTRSGPARRSGR